MENVSLAGAPAIVRPPQSDGGGAPVIVLWHGFGPPGSKKALADLLPLDDVPAWKVYPDLPLFGERLPEGGIDELTRRQLSDYVLDLLLPIAEQAVVELPQLVREVERQYGADASGGIGLFGFSGGAATAIHALLDGSVPVRAAVFAGAPPSLGVAVANVERGMRAEAERLRASYDWFEDRMLTYEWTEASEAARSQFDLRGRAPEVAAADRPPAVLLLHGQRDEMFAVDDAEAIGEALRAAYRESGASERTEVRTFPHLMHHLDPEAGTDAERDLADLREAVVGWYNRYLLA